MRGSLYTVNDKSIFDALNNAKVTNSDLRNLFLSRGIIISTETSRNQLAEIFSCLMHSYSDYQELAKIFSSTRKREKINPLRILSDISIDKIELGAESLKAELQNDDTKVNILKWGESTLEIKINYRSMDFNKTEFKQLTNNEATIIIEKEKNSVSIRGPLNPMVQIWTEQLVDYMKEEAEEDFTTIKISLSHIQHYGIRTKFFINLISCMEGYQLYNVTDVFVYHINIDNEEILEDKEITESGIHIDKASLSGQGVLQSSELNDLFEKGFYISRIIWQSTLVDQIDSDIYSFEALFSEPETCTNFSYLPKGFIKYKGQGEYNKSVTNFSKDEEGNLNRLLEKAAYTALELTLEELKIDT